MTAAEANKPASLLTWQRLLPFVLVIGGAIGLLASLTLTYDKLQILKDPSYVPSCSINPVLSCGSVMNSPQAEVFGFPNPILGLMAFSAVIVFGVFLMAGTSFAKWIWWAAQIAVVAGVLFVHYLFFQSLFVLNAICPWCFVVWLVVIAMFWGVTIDNLRQRRLGNWHDKFTSFIHGNHSGLILASWYAAILLAILWRFWDYWKTLI